MTAPLAGTRVIDLTSARSWLAGRVLADLGAEVVAVEPPGGDPGRQVGPFAGGATDPEANLRWWFQARGKRSIVADLTTPAGRGRALGLVDGADVVLEDFGPGRAEALGFDAPSLLARNPQLVVTSITPFGRTGPYATWAGPDLVVGALCGVVWLTGDPDRAPVRISVPQLDLHAAVEAATQSLVALYHAGGTGQGQHVDVSAQDAGLRLLMNAQAFPLLEGRNQGRNGGYVGYRTAAMRCVFACADGHVAVLVLAGRVGGHLMNAFTRRAGEEAELPAHLAAFDWVEADLHAIAQLGPGFLGDVEAMMAGYFARRTKAELYADAVASGFLLAPVNTVADARVDEQLAARGFFRPVDQGSFGAVHHPGPWAVLSATPLATSAPAPGVGEHDALVRARPRRPHLGLPAPAQVFEGLKVFDMSWVGVGPITGSYLANHGATVVKLDCSARPDVLRLTQPYAGEPGLNRSHFYADMNPSKLGVGIDLTVAPGRALALRLAAWADVVLESFTPGTLADLGLGYDDLRAVNPSVVLLSTCMQGQTGPRARYRGFGQLMAAMSGFYEVTGWPDRDPAMVWGAYTDFINPRFCAAALVAAVDHRRRTGEGQHIDVSQFEGALQFLGPELLDLEVNGRVATRRGNDDDTMAPHGVYPCRPTDAGAERWVAVACEDDAQWAALRRALGDPGWAADPALATAPGRVAARRRLDEALGAWTAARTPDEVVGLLQPRVAAGVVHDQSGVHADPQIAHRGYFVPAVHTVMGEVPYQGLAARFSATPWRVSKAAPCIGEDTFTILTDILGMSDDEVGDLLAALAVEITSE